MPNLINNVQSIYNTFSDIKQALENKGVEIPDYTPVTVYPNYITGSIGDTRFIKKYHFTQLEEGIDEMTTLRITGTTVSETADNIRQAIANLVIGKDENDENILLGTVNGEYIEFDNYNPKIRIYVNNNAVVFSLYCNGTTATTSYFGSGITTQAVLSYHVIDNSSILFWISSSGVFPTSSSDYIYYYGKAITLDGTDEDKVLLRGYSTSRLYYTFMENTDYQGSKYFNLSYQSEVLSIENTTNQLLTPVSFPHTPYISKDLYYCSYLFSPGTYLQDGINQYLVMLNTGTTNNTKVSILLQIK